MKIAIIGSGIAGLTSAYLLSRRHDVTLFEAQGWIGGHARSLDIALDGIDHRVDVGFTLFNDRTYPNFFQLLRQLGVGCRPAKLSFSVSDPQSGMEYARRTLNSLFAQRRNLLSPSFWGMLREVLRFNREVNEDLQFQRISDTLTLENYLELGDYGQTFIDYYIVPLGGSIWSLSKAELMQFPLLLFTRVLRSLGLLTVNSQPQWYVVDGGTRAYIDALTAGFREQIRLKCPVWRVEREEHGVRVMSAAGDEHFDKVIFACHSDQALKLLTRPTPAERSILGAMPFIDSEVVLHTDTGLLPRRRRAWAAWNYRLGARDDQPVAVTYDMTRLQGVRPRDQRFCVSLNQSELIAPKRILARVGCAHPLFSRESVEAQARWRELYGPNHTYYCGAYWGSGFHEDGVVSALRVAEAFGESLAGPLAGTPPAAQVFRPAVCS